MKLLTIGHSNHSLVKFVRLLNENGVMILVDVRSAPYSRYSPQFNKANLEHDLPRYDIQYVFAGNYLGGRPTDPGCYKSRTLPSEDADYLLEVDYKQVMEKKWFTEGVQQLLEIADQDLTAIMCSEEDPAQCHRHHLIVKYIMEVYPDWEIQHIRGDGVVFGARSILKSVDTPSAEQPKLF